MCILFFNTSNVRCWPQRGILFFHLFLLKLEVVDQIFLLCDVIKESHIVIFRIKHFQSQNWRRVHSNNFCQCIRKREGKLQFDLTLKLDIICIYLKENSLYWHLLLLLTSIYLTFRDFCVLFQILCICCTKIFKNLKKLYT